MTVEVEFHPPVTIDGFSSRKALAEHCQRVIADGVARAISGRPDGPSPAKHAAVPAAAGTATSTATPAPPVADPAPGSA
jgi:1-acyl-sn-glycerol-3-phosphate acyltransferase